MKLLYSFILCCLSLFFSINASANGTLDSLVNRLEELKDKNGADELMLKANLSEEISDLYNKLYADQEFSRIYLLQAISFVEKRMKITDQVEANDAIHFVDLYRKLSLFEAAKSNMVAAEQYMDKCENSLKLFQRKLSNDEYYKALFDIYHSKFALSLMRQDFSSAENSLLTCYSLIEKSEKLSNMGMNVLSELSLVYSVQGKHDQSIKSAREGLELFIKNPQDGIPKDRYIYFLLRAQNAAGRLKDVLATVENLPPYTSLTEMKNYLEENDQMVTRTFFENIFILGNANASLYTQTDSLAYIRNAYEWMNNGFLLAEELTVTRDGDKIGNVLLKPKEKLSNFLKIHQQLTMGEGVSRERLIEVVRVLDVYQSSRLHLERISYEVNATSWMKEKELKNELNFINTKLGESNGVIKDAALKDSLSNAFNQLSYELARINKATKRDLILDEYVIGRKEFSKLTDAFLTKNNKTFISYFYAPQDSVVYISGIGPKNEFFKGVKVDTSFSSLIRTAYELNASFQLKGTQLRQQDSLNSALYNYLIAPVVDELNTTSILLYPLNEMSYISFDALLTPQNEYLVHQHDFQYTSSLYSLLNPDLNTTNNNSSISFYPTNYGVDSLAYLTNAKTEVAAFKNEFQATTFEGNNATKANFLTAVKHSKIVHLASHSILNVNQPYESYIVFDATEDTLDNKLHAYEVFSKTIEADLVTLSSCNSAKGKIEEGIGVVSLSNAFYFAGVPAMISSMWNAQDKSSSAIMVTFYQQLKKGNTKATSLQAAKIDYLNRADKVKKQPFFWANYVLYGSDEPVYKASGKKNSWLTLTLYAAGVFSIVMIALWFVRKKRRRLV